MERLSRMAARMADIEPFHVMDLVAQATRLEASGRDIVSMQVGEPDFPTAQPIIDAALRHLRTGEMRYTAATGIAPLREAIASFYADRYGVAVSPDRIIVTPGASGALLLTAGVLVDREDEILMADPGYPCNRHFVRLMEGKARPIPVDPTSSYQLTPDSVDTHWSDSTVGVLLGSPSNPTGTLLDDDDLRRIIALASHRGATAIVDEIYHGLVYDGNVSTALRFSDEVFIINSFSKYFGMTGWRLGWIVAPEHSVRDLDKLAQNLFLAPSTVAQHAALAAFAPETIGILDGRRELLRTRRDFLVPALRSLGFSIPVEPSGAFYVYADVSRFTSDSFDFATELLHKAGVAVTPGKDFGSNRPERHVRFAYTTSMDRLEEGVRRIDRYLRES